MGILWDGEDFADLPRCYTATIADERLRLRYVALAAAIVRAVTERPGLTVPGVARIVGADELVVADEVRHIVHRGGLRWIAGGLQIAEP